MKNAIILVLFLVSSFGCSAAEPIETFQVGTGVNEQQLDSLGCLLAFEDNEIMYGSFTVHMLTAVVDFYYCTYDPVSLQIEIYSGSENHYAGANSKLWTLKETFGVPTGGGLNYQCFLDEIQERDLILP